MLDLGPRSGSSRIVQKLGAGGMALSLSSGSLRRALATAALLAIAAVATAAPPEAAAPSAASGSFQQHYEAAVQLFLSERYPEALKEFEAAYAVRQLPRLLINIGTTHRKLGEAKAALSAYEAYLRIEPNPDPEVKKKLDEALSQVHAMLNVAAAPTAKASPEGAGGKVGASGKVGKHGRGKAAQKSPETQLKPSFAVVNLDIDRLKPQAANKPGFSSITGTGPQDIWAVGTAGTLIHFDGQRWSDASSYWGGSLKRLYGTGAKDVWAVGEHGVILHYDGSAWFRVPSSTRELLRGLWLRPGRGDTPGDAWALDTAGTLLRFDGTSWLELPHDSTETVRITDVHATPQGDVWAVGAGGVIQHWEGKALVSKVSGTTRGLLAVFSNSPSDVWAVGEQATILNENYDSPIRTYPGARRKKSGGRRPSPT